MEQLQRELNRIWEIDVLRALAICLMVIYHTVYDLNVFVNVAIDYTSTFWFWEGKIAALIFIFVSGISSGLSSRNIVYTGLKILIFAMVITVVTYLVLGDEYIRYGILHFLGTCMVLFPLLKRFDVWGLTVIAIVIFVMFLAFREMLVDTFWFLPIGIAYAGFRSVDFYPLFPYLSVYICGVISYKLYYYKKKSLFSYSYSNPFVQKISKHSLLIYIVHQPIIIGVILFFDLLFNMFIMSKV
ncbi:hypothetical protein BHU72_05625 [Desulfuribacillus stibiiarsenatis]|uniref:Heparan-alpha-glucosaminide N-acetyltransferase catalytic domain-containing protein n=1 Tax=Desulfuribacillus stibiiarsenatis TaxID=1390249 RepID=A0A1E5L543_9FIRM|nr:heparan-alpha-glucosaminide N-acetyltransferase [Desulfuribacillus stibiiarsenatis]OEH85089.1 hypothetical protein BHU72_05625 [Desulfuribacillus stibiiarsenatis]